MTTRPFVAIAIDASGDVYAAGNTASRAGFPLTSNALHHCNSGSASELWWH